MPSTISLPFDLGSKGYVLSAQSWGGSTSHTGYFNFGTDFSLAKGDKVYAIASGVVIDLREDVRDGNASSTSKSDPSNGPSNLGNFVTVHYPQLDLYVTYAHLAYNSVVPKVGASVSPNAVLGQVGNTGYRDATHFHLQLGSEVVKMTTGKIADGSSKYGTPAWFDTATGRIETGIVSAVTHDLTSDKLKQDQHNLTLVGSKDITGRGDSSDNIISGNRGNNILEGLNGDDDLYGGGGTDTLRGGGDEDHLYGGSGSDTLDGGAGSDRLEGESGRDTLIGGSGKDTIYGGSDADVFVFSATSDSRVGDADRVMDFSRSQHDQIDISGIDANTARNGDQAFKFIGNQNFHHIAGELTFQNGSVYGDVNGDGRADFEIRISGMSSMSASDFIL